MKRVLMMLAVCGLLATAAYAAQQPADYAGAAQAKHWHEVDTDFMNKFHHPMENLEMGLDLRLREVYGRNILALNEDLGNTVGENWNNYHWQRYRTRLSAKWLLDEDVTFNTRLTWEFWSHTAPEHHSPGVSDEFFGRQNTEFDEAIFDTMNIQFRNAFDLPLTLTIGRQDIILGTGWLVLDGTPADGSRTIFFDAVRGTYDLTDSTKLDVIYIQQYDDENKWIKPFNHSAVENRRHLTNKSDERGFIFYLTNKMENKQQQEVYYIYKDDENSKWGDRYSGIPGQSAHIHTIGGRLAGPLDDNWSYSAELAKQFGDRNGSSLQALGANTKLMYAFNDDKKNEVHVGYEYLSGDDPDSGADEQFDSLWGDWPQYQRGGDLQSYMWAFEGDGLGNVTNLHRIGVGHSFKPHKDWTLATDYNAMFADENTFAGASRGPGGGVNFSNGGNFRGHMLTGLLTYRCCKNFKTEFLVDYFIPGNYYSTPSGDEAMFARINMEWTF